MAAMLGPSGLPDWSLMLVRTPEGPLGAAHPESAGRGAGASRQPCSWVPAVCAGMAYAIALAVVLLASTSPTTVPSTDDPGPPELPGLSGVSVWMSPPRGPLPTSMVRAMPLTQPLVRDSWPARG